MSIQPPRVPKREGAINPINPRGAGNARSRSGRKSSIASSIIDSFRQFLAGSPAFDVLQGLVFFSYFIFEILVAAFSESPNKIMII